MAYIPYDRPLACLFLLDLSMGQAPRLSAFSRFLRQARGLSHRNGQLFRSLHKAADGNRTHDLILTKDALYQLSYSSNCSRPSADTRGATNNPADSGYTTTMAKKQND